MITKEELAQMLNGNQYGNECPNQEDKLAKENNLVIVFGYSDDNMEFEGAIDDEVGCYDGGFAYVTKDGLLQNECDYEDYSYFKKEQEKAQKIEAIWDTGGYSWIYKTNIPHAVFEILEDEDKYCLGIVFSLDDLK